MQHLIDSLEKQKSDLDKMDANVAEMYAKRCKKKSADLLALMKVGGWLSADEALAWGFVDELTEFEDEAAPVLTEALAADFTAHGIPLPKMQSATKPEDITAFRRFIQACASFFKTNDNPQITDNKTNDNPEQQETTKPPMNKVFKNICALLACEFLASADDKVTLTTAQLDTLEADMANKEKRISDLTAQVNTLTESNASLKEKLEKLPAASTQNVVDTKKTSTPEAEKSDIERFYDTTNSAQALFDALP